MEKYHDTFLEGNELIEAAIDRYCKERSKENQIAVLDTIRQRMHADGHFIFPVLVHGEDEDTFSFRTVQTKNGKIWNVAFTSHEEYEKGRPTHVDIPVRGNRLSGGLETASPDNRKPLPAYVARSALCGAPLMFRLTELALVF